MFLYSLSLNADDLSVARKHLSTKLPAIKRSHLAEAVAAALGFNTSIALQTAIRDNPVGEKRYSRFDTDAFFTRLELLGYAPTKDERKQFRDIEFPSSIALDYVVSWGGIIQSTLSELGSGPDLRRGPKQSMVDLCKTVLSEIKEFRDTPNEDCSSYGLKHCIERKFLTFITNGALIQAALELGMKVDAMTEGPNAYFYVDKEVFEKAVDARYAIALAAQEASEAAEASMNATEMPPSP